MADAIISREDAQAKGLKRYFTGHPCRRGHVAERQTINTQCMECAREKSADNWANRDTHKELSRRARWRSANRCKLRRESADYNNRDTVKQRKAAWYQANKDRLRPAKLARYVEQREERVAYSKAWAAANPERYAEHMRIAARTRRARKHKSGERHTTADLAEIFAAQSGRCAYCRVSLKHTKKHVDHIAPLARGGSNGRENLQYLCQPCNQAKNWKDPIAFAQSIGLLL